MLRNIFLSIMMFSTFNYMSAQSRHATTKSVIKAYEQIQAFNFKTADTILRNINNREKDELYDLANANYLWWLIISGEDNHINRTEYINSSNDAISKLKNKPLDSLTDEELYTVITGYANKARIEGLNKNYMKGFVHINTCLKYIQKSFGKENQFIYFNLTSGLYNYYIATANRSFPILVPYLALYPKGDVQKGKNMLTIASVNGDKLLATEGHYFLLKVYLDEKQFDLSESHCNWLLREYPNNLLYNYYRFKILLDQGKKEDALNALSVIRLKEMMNNQLTVVQKKHYSGLATKDLKEYYYRQESH